MREPLRKLRDEQEIGSSLHHTILTDEMFGTVAEFLQPLLIIKESIQKLRLPRQPTIQHALPIIWSLGRIHEVDKEKLAP
jgi:hypothetical protein